MSWPKPSDYVMLPNDSEASDKSNPWFYGKKHVKCQLIDYTLRRTDSTVGSERCLQVVQQLSRSAPSSLARSSRSSLLYGEVVTPATGGKGSPKVMRIALKKSFKERFLDEERARQTGMVTTRNFYYVFLSLVS